MKYQQDAQRLLSQTVRPLVLILITLILIVSSVLAQSTLTPRTKTIRHEEVNRAPSSDDLVVPLLPFFLPAVTYGADGSVYRAVATADLNLDKIMDVVVTNGNGVAVLLGNGDGTLRTPVAYDSGGLEPSDVKAIDVNRDGTPDIVALNACGHDDGFCLHPTLGVLLGNGDGTYQPVMTYELTGIDPESFSVVDVNRDGKADVILTACVSCFGSSGAVGVLLGNGDGTFRPPVFYPSGGYLGKATAVADLNGDNKRDIIVTNTCSAYCLTGEGEGSVGILLGNGDGTFQPAVTYDVAAYSPNHVVVADLNRDGKQDLVITGCRGSDGGVGCYWLTASVLLGNGDGTFQPAVPYYVVFGGTSDALAVGDINKDGNLDVLLSDYVLLGNGDGTFQPPQLTGSGNDFEISLVDLNGDARPDLVAANLQAGVDVQLHVGNIVTTTTLTSSPNPAVYGQEAFTATVHSGSGVPTGNVIFYNELYPPEVGVIGSATLVGGSATIPGVGGAGTGTDPIAAVYQGTTKYHPSLSPVLEQVVTKATTTASVTPSLNPASVGLVTYTVNLIGQYGVGVPSVAVCLDNGSSLESLRGKPLQFRVKYTAPGTHTILCSYPGDDNHYPSTAPTLTEIVLYKTATVVTTSGSPSVLGQPVNFTVTVTSVFGSIPNGELVTFTYGKKVLGTAPLSNGVAVLTTPALPIGTDPVVGSYAGDANFGASRGHVSQVVTP